MSDETCPTTRLIAALAAAPKPRVKAMQWYAPDPTDIADSEECILMAVGYGGRYSISQRQLVRRADAADHMGYLLWDACEPFTFTEHLTVADAQAAAQVDYDRRILSALEDQS